MAVRRIHWKKEKPPPRFIRPGVLTEDEEANVRAAIQTLKKRFGTFAKMAEHMKMCPGVLRRAAVVPGKQSIGIALEVARTAGVTVDEVISGEPLRAE